MLFVFLFSIPWPERQEPRPKRGLRTPPWSQTNQSRTRKQTEPKWVGRSEALSALTSYRVQLRTLCAQTSNFSTCVHVDHMGPRAKAPGKVMEGIAPPRGPNPRCFKPLQTLVQKGTLGVKPELYAPYEHSGAMLAPLEQNAPIRYCCPVG